jgi:scyllo-inositol 2-dehydrogenase (NADP+)
MGMSEHYCAIVGLGGMGNWHRELICGEGIWNNRDCGQIDNLHLAGSYDIREERQQFARSVGLHTYESIDDVLEDEKVDIVLCTTPNDIHKEIVFRALEAGKNVVCEKPAALNSIQFQEMTDKAAQVGKLLMVHQNRRWDEDFLAVKNLYEKQLLGMPFRIESRVQGSRGIPGDWRQLPERGGGMVLDWGVHLLDQALMMIPEKVKTVYATFTNVTNGLVEDGFTIELTFESGLVFIAEVGTNNFIALPRWYVLCRDGTATINDWKEQGKMVYLTDRDKKDAVPVRTAAGLTKTMAPRTPDSIGTKPLPQVKADIRDFYRNVMAVIEQKADQVVKLEEVKRVMLLMDAVFQSARSHQVVTFES